MAATTSGDNEELIFSTVREAPNGQMSQDALQKATNMAITDLAVTLNQLLQKSRLQILQAANGLVYKAQSEEEQMMFKNLGKEDLLVYQTIEQSGNKGIWTKDIKRLTNVSQPKITKILKVLENRKLVKSVKSVQHANRRVYMLYNMEPSKEISGGAWYNNTDFDQEFVEVLREAAFKYIMKHGQASLGDISTFIRNKGFAKVALGDEDINLVVQTLVFDGQIENVDIEDGNEQFRPCTLKVPDDNAFTSIPCGQCPVFHQCCDDGPVCPAKCEYFTKWMEF